MLGEHTDVIKHRRKIITAFIALILLLAIIFLIIALIRRHNRLNEPQINGNPISTKDLFYAGDTLYRIDASFNDYGLDFTLMELGPDGNESPVFEIGEGSPVFCPVRLNLYYTDGYSIYSFNLESRKNEEVYSSNEKLKQIDCATANYLILKKEEGSKALLDLRTKEFKSVNGFKGDIVICTFDDAAAICEYYSNSILLYDCENDTCSELKKRDNTQSTVSNGVFWNNELYYLDGASVGIIKLEEIMSERHTEAKTLPGKYCIALDADDDYIIYAVKENLGLSFYTIDSFGNEEKLAYWQNAYRDTVSYSPLIIAASQTGFAACFKHSTNIFIYNFE